MKTLFVVLFMFLSIASFSQSDFIERSDTVLTYGFIKGSTVKDSIYIVQRMVTHKKTGTSIVSKYEFFKTDGTHAENLKYVLFFDGEKFHWIRPDEYVEYKNKKSIQKVWI